MRQCVNCSSVTSYSCLSCAKAVCNKSHDCSVPANEDVLGWKAGVSVSYCRLCYSSSKNDKIYNKAPEIAPQHVNVSDQSAKSSKKAKQIPKVGNADGRRCLALSEKVEVIRISQQKGASARNLAERFKCGRTQILKVLKDKNKTLEMWSSNEAPKIQKRCNHEKFSEINHLLWQWYVRARESNVPINGPMLMEEARLIADRLGEKSFQGTEGWLTKWKQRHNIKQMNIAGEEGDVNQEIVESWQERVKELTRNYAPQDVWNQDETGTFWRTLPEKSLGVKGKRCRGGKNAKQRVTAAFFVNAAGGKESPVLIGRSKKPRCFAKLKDISSPYGAQYFSNDKAWMRSDIMINVLTKLNNRMKRDDRHIVLFIDNAPCHPQSLKGMFSNIEVQFLPANTTSRTQPLDAGIIKTWKVYYRRKLLRYIVSQIEGGKKASEIVKSVNLLMAVRWMVSAWEEVRPEIIIKCFRHVGMYPDEQERMNADEDDDPFAGEELLDALETRISQVPGLDISDVANIDDDVPAYQESVYISDPIWKHILRDEIVEGYFQSQSPDVVDSNDEEGLNIDFDPPLQTPAVCSVSGALGLANQLAEFADWQGNEELANVVARVSDILVDFRMKSLTQSSITSYLTTKLQ